MIPGVVSSQLQQDAAVSNTPTVEENSAGAASLWNALDKNGSISLSNNDLTATCTVSAASGRCVRSTNSRSSGKWYFEWQPSSIVDATLLAVGFGVSTAPLNAFIGSQGGGANFSCGHYASGHASSGDGATTDAGKPVAVGEWARIAIDIDAGKFWVGDSTGFAGDPAAGTGNTESFTAATYTLFAMFSANGLNDSVTANFGETAFQYTPPTGFAAWDS